ncbi:hypothetical protein ACRAWF_02475 [Streptomyces sp. L7]
MTRGHLDLAAEHLSHEFRALGQLPLEAHMAALRHLLAVPVLRLAHLTVPADGSAPEPDETYLRFRDVVERNFTRTRRVEDYARMLGHSARTLARATLTGAGLSAKEFVDRRVVLEAKRLLARQRPHRRPDLGPARLRESLPVQQVLPAPGRPVPDRLPRRGPGRRAGREPAGGQNG